MKILDTEPKSIIAGQKISWKKYLADYSPKEGWELLYYFRSNDAGFEVKTNAQDDYYLINLLPENTKDCKPGTYWWYVFIDQGVDTEILDQGELVIKPNLALLKTYDGRSHVKKVLDALEDLILGKASRDQMSYSISGRSLSRFSPTELLKWRDVYKAEYARELQQEKISRGLGNSSSIKVRFTQVQ